MANSEAGRGGGVGGGGGGRDGLGVRGEGGREVGGGGGEGKNPTALSQPNPINDRMTELELTKGVLFSDAMRPRQT